MTEIRKIIDAETAKGNDVIISDGEVAMERMFGGGWSVIGEWGWNSTEEEVDQMEVVKVEEYGECITEIIVKSTGWA